MTVDLSWLATYRSSEPHFGLERMEAILALRGNPHLVCPVIHLAGTNGKGSTIAHLRSLLEVRGLRVGVFSSPYLVSFNEQIGINGVPISDKDLEDYLALYRDLLERNSSDQTLLGLTEFELITAMAFDYFAAEKPDVVIMEVGMGGRLDSTNVCQPILTAITTIGLDHVALLGPDVASIAREKAGIIKEKIPVLLGRIELEAQEVIVQEAHRLSAPVEVLGQDFLVCYQESLADGEVFTYQSQNRSEVQLKTGLLGIYQVDNAGLALALCDAFFQERGLSLLSQDEIIQAWSQVQWPGRLEIISTQPLIILDGAHNPHAVRPLIETLQERYAQLDKQVLFTCIQTKAIEEMLDLWLELEGSQLTLTTFEDPRAYSVKETQEIALQKGLPHQEWKLFLTNYIEKESQQSDLLLVTGSLYFLAQVRAFLIEKISRR
ncbi:dihydrofolate synthase [Streptococcus rubneri]|jgi:bifunctional protein folC|uniref:tetrahydrofolate synthase n=1 Tax=Streptococcus rubneri TaxID=1234680 RepID=A0A4Z1DTC9_9STRE|nr:folylpolyglutamate synthase/dihydrofolate synthase family protein [Streptococcus rubneri]MBK4774187.1 dihydrofolate synthase [Streptococcus rubneri]TGN91126.1 bifunctional folylpolyglutamate synthase/dihydrofolate synthase [Streptococcus rubneri]